MPGLECSLLPQINITVTETNSPECGQYERKRKESKVFILFHIKDLKESDEKYLENHKVLKALLILASVPYLIELTSDKTGSLL